MTATMNLLMEGILAQFILLVELTYVCKNELTIIMLI